MKNILVTGGAGFIGSHVADRFLAQGCAVTVLDDLSSGKRENLARSVRMHELDICSQEAHALVRDGDFDVIAHLAAQIDVRKSVSDPQFDARVNVLGTINLLEAVRARSSGRPARLVFASTGGALYGDSAPVPTAESAAANPDAPYGVDKLSAELFLGYYARVWSLDTVALRFGNVYGPRQNPHGEAGVIAIFSQLMHDDKALIVFGDGSQTRDYVYVEDVADAFIAASTRILPVPGPLGDRSFNIGTGVETSVTAMAKMLGDIAGRPARIERRPARAGELQRSVLDVAKAKTVLGWQAKIDLRAGLARTYAWLSAH
jgi:UDP-glucose 4-epimerase